MKASYNRIVIEGLTFDDVLLLPAASDVLPRDVELSTRFSRHIPLSAPIVFRKISIGSLSLRLLLLHVKVFHTLHTLFLRLQFS